MRFRFMVLATIVLIGAPATALWYRWTFDGFTARQAVARQSHGATVVGEHDTSIGRVLILRGRTPPDAMGLVVHEYEYSYAVVARSPMPLFWRVVSNNGCKPISTNNVLAAITYRAPLQLAAGSG